MTPEEDKRLKKEFEQFIIDSYKETVRPGGRVPDCIVRGVAHLMYSYIKRDYRRGT